MTSSSSATDTGTIFHLMTEIPQIHDFSRFGPFHARDAMVFSIQQKLEDETLTGLEEFLDFVSEPSGLDDFEGFTTRTTDGNTLNIYVVEEKNPEVAATLPGPAWVVVTARFNMIPYYQKDHEVGRTYTSAEAANQGAKELLVEMMPGARYVEHYDEKGLFVGATEVAGEAVLVTVSYDRGPLPAV
ncbi:hypothetical protein ACMFMG_002766 [Clarireedia jacksonii]